MAKRILMDTNVLVSGLFFKGNERRVLEGVFAGQVILVLPEAVLHETLRVIERKFAGSKRLGNALGVLGALVSKAELVSFEQARPHAAKALSLIRHVNDVPILASALSARPCGCYGRQGFSRAAAATFSR